MFAAVVSSSTGGSSMSSTSLTPAAPPTTPTSNIRGCGVFLRPKASKTTATTTARTTTKTSTSASPSSANALPNMLSELNFEETKILPQDRMSSKTRASSGNNNNNNKNNLASSSSTRYDGNNNNNNNNRNTTSSSTLSDHWQRRSFFSNFRDGLFCLSYLDESGDQDLFYDAVQDSNALPPLHDDYSDGDGSNSKNTNKNADGKSTSKHLSTMKTLSLRGGSGSDHSDPIQNATEWGQEVQHYPPTHDVLHRSSNYFTPHSSFSSLLAEPQGGPSYSSSDTLQDHHHHHPTLYYPSMPPEHLLSNGNQHQYQQQQQSTTTTVTSLSTSYHQANHLSPFTRIQSPPAPPVSDLPDRFLRAGKGDVTEGKRRYEATLEWRRQHNIDGILLEPHPNFDLIKQHYPHYYHGRGYNNEPVFFEQPPKTNLQALKAAGIDLDGLVRHYTMVTEFQWQFIEPNDYARSITVLDLEGIRMMDFVGECVDYVRKCSHFTGQHYPERAGYVIVINIPRWFAMIWNVVKPMVDDVTLKKISIVRGKNEVFQALLDKIPIEHIPKEYGGKSRYALGDSPEERDLKALMAHNNALAKGDFSCGGRAAKPPCRFCSWGPVRSY